MPLDAFPALRRRHLLGLRRANLGQAPRNVRAHATLSKSTSFRPAANRLHACFPRLFGARCENIDQLAGWGLGGGAIGVLAVWCSVPIAIGMEYWLAHIPLLERTTTRECWVLIDTGFACFGGVDGLGTTSSKLAPTSSSSERVRFYGTGGAGSSPSHGRYRRREWA
ncbi:hypothetical protein C8R45DRAFT_1114588 [Mycena sanguinolenta]|nr:hypothetical protein C8R45DRAFT_1114588 [Mycena sanguinolenta]